MKAYVAPIPLTLSRSIHRLAAALTRYAPPDVEIVADPAEADLLLCHMIGQEGWAEHLDAVAARGRRYAIWQHCLITTRDPHPFAWARLWQDAAVVASCYDLATAWRTAQTAADDAMLAVYHRTPNFVRVPLGVAADVFRPDPAVTAYRYLVVTSGYVADTECVGEWGAVCNTVERTQYHLGPNLAALAYRLEFQTGITDGALATAYNRAQFVSGLRRSEGFELPAYEGLACGARPVMFRREDAGHWLGDHAEYIDEGPFDDVVAQLTALVQGPYRPVTADEIRWVAATFPWARTAAEFWAAVPR